MTATELPPPGSTTNSLFTQQNSVKCSFGPGGGGETTQQSLGTYSEGSHVIQCLRVHTAHAQRTLWTTNL